MNATHHTFSLFLPEPRPPAAPLAAGGAGGISVVAALALELGAALVTVAELVWAEEPSFVTLVGSELDDGEGAKVVEASDKVVEAKLEDVKMMEDGPELNDGASVYTVEKVSDATLEAPEMMELSSDVSDDMTLDTPDGRGVCVVMGVVGAALFETTGVLNVATVVGTRIEDKITVEDGAEADDLAELAGGTMTVPDVAAFELADVGITTVVGTITVPDEEPPELTDDGMTTVVEVEGSTNDTETETEPEVAGGGMITVVGAEGTGVEMNTVLASGGIRFVEPEGIAVKLVAELVGAVGRMTTVVEIAGGGTTTGPEVDGIELELKTETEGAEYPTVCETMVDWDTEYVT
jgi:hypothetical protein